MNIKKFLNRVREEGLAVWSPDILEIPEEGIAFSMYKEDTAMSDDRDLARFIFDESNKYFLIRGMIYVIGFKESDRISVNLCRVFNDKGKVLRNIKNSIINGTRVFDIKNNKEIILPSPQSCGTEYQKNTYNEMKAEQICKSLGYEKNSCYRL